MPKYEYACRSCDERLEVTQSFADAPLTECPACGGPLRKVFSAPSIAFKGSGFYRTDNRKRRPSDPKTDTKTDTDTKADTKVDASSDAGAPSETKTDPKSEPAKKEAAPAAEAKPKAAEAKTA